MPRSRARDTNAEPLKVAIYVRVSTAREEMVSPEIQQTAINAFIDRQAQISGRPWQVVAEEHDLDMSGRNFVRAGVNRLIAGVEDGSWERIVVYNYSRFGRNLTGALTHIAKVEAAGGQVVSASEPFDVDTAVGRFSRSQMLALAQLQSDQISESWKAAQDHRVSRGLPGGGSSRWGYRYHINKAASPCPLGCERGTCRTGYEPDPVLGPVLAECYRRYIAGDGFALLMDYLVDGGHPTSRGKKWTLQTIIRMMDSGWAAGYVRHRGDLVKGAHEPVIDEATWAKYQQVRATRAKRPYRARNPKWALSGIAVCGICGENLSSASNKGKENRSWSSVVRCPGHTKADRCPGVYITAKKCEEAAFAVVERWIDAIDREGRAAANTSRRRRPDRDASERQRLTRLIAREEGRLARWLEAYGDGALSLAEYRTAKRDTEASLTQARASLAALEDNRAARPTRRQARSLREQWPTLDPAVKNRIIASLVERLIVYPRKPKGTRKAMEGPRINIVMRPGITL